MIDRTPELWQSHEYVNPNQIVAAEKMDKLMFECWRKGLKRKDILPLAQEICSSTSEQDVSAYFRHMFLRELSATPLYLNQ